MYVGKFSYLDIVCIPSDLRRKLVELLIETKEKELEERKKIEAEIENESAKIKANI